ncbi:hypothetical protein CDD80_5808 [Ophiocordyceps camponoti-rufipedis]|uniref:Uncharacterized protein n=1 Tax=Ophiocordyceps camponoti-rufipedis TaxID=2004952 RepID=A0A2C5YS23_9HYPO|nr:hypothetical protein CDD80_5808 [Ophiocordyceps camponoti-rufipedis]
MLRLLYLAVLVSAAAVDNWSNDIHALLPTGSQDPIPSLTNFRADAASKPPFGKILTSADASPWAVASSTVPLATSASRQQSVYPTAGPRRSTSLESSVSTTASSTSETSPAESTVNGPAAATSTSGSAASNPSRFFKNVVAGVVLHLVLY